MSINYRAVMASLKEKVSRRISTNVEKRISDKQGILNSQLIMIAQWNLEFIFFLEKVKAVKVKLQCRNDFDKPMRYLTVILKHDQYKIRGQQTDSDDSC